MNLQGQLTQFLVDPTLYAEYLVVAGGSGGARGGGGDGGNGGNAGQVQTGQVRLVPGSYAITVGSGGVGGAFPSTTDTAGGNSSIASLVTATGGARNLSGGNGTGASGSGRTGVTSSLSGSAIEYGIGGLKGPFPGNSENGAAVTANRGHGGNGGGDAADSGDGGSGSAGSAGIVYVWYPGSARGTGGTITTVNGGTLHAFTSNGTLDITS